MYHCSKMTLILQGKYQDPSRLFNRLHLVVVSFHCRIPQGINNFNFTHSIVDRQSAYFQILAITNGAAVNILTQAYMCVAYTQEWNYCLGTRIYVQPQLIPPIPPAISGYKALPTLRIFCCLNFIQVQVCIGISL